MAEWWVFAHGREMGPVSTEQLTNLARTLGVAGILVWREGMADWQPLGEVAELQLQPVAAPREVAAPPSPRRRQVLSIAAVLALTIGIVFAAQDAGIRGRVLAFLKPAAKEKVADAPKPPATVAPASPVAAPSRDDVARTITEASPVFAVIREKFAARSDAAIDSYLERTAGGGTPAEALEKITHELVTFVLLQLPKADDDVLLDYNRLLVDQLGAFNAKDPTYCYQYASGSQFSPKIFRELPAQIQLRDRDLQVRAVHTARDRDAPRPDEIQGLFGRVRAQLEESKANLAILDLKQVPRERHGEYCEATIRFFAEIGKLPAREAAALMRIVLGAR